MDSPKQLQGRFPWRHPKPAPL
uniref:Uncharacterized protein n=1 Tax=Arundo donax TaxID=35708 RepID=A0A0A9CQ95_ARUDO